VIRVTEPPIEKFPYNRSKLQALLKWYFQEAGEKLISVLVVSREGLITEILTRNSQKSEENKFIGAFSSLIELVLKKLTKEFDLGTFGAGTFDTDKYRFIFCESGDEHVLVSIFDALTMVDTVFPYTYIAAEKVARIMDGSLPVSPVIPKLSRKRKAELIRKKSFELIKRKQMSSDYIYKLSLLGDGGVGKTSMVQRYVHGIFSEAYKATIGTYISKREIQFDELDTKVRFVIWDLAGQEQFKRMWPDYLADSNAGLIIFDVTNRISFENVRRWYDQIIKVASKNILVLILVGNKVDMEDSRVISVEEAEKLAKEFDVEYIETSAKTNENMEEVFERIALTLLEKAAQVSQVFDDVDLIAKKQASYIINEGQLQFLRHFFEKQLEIIIDKKEYTKYIKYLDLLRDIERKSI